MISNTAKSKRYPFIRRSNIGDPDALRDGKFLPNAFFDTGDLAILLDMDDSRCIVVGRTGAGKTALLEAMRQTKSSVIPIDPKELGLSYLASRPILKNLIEFGVNMDQFYRMMWRKVFIGEVLKKHYRIENDITKTNFVNNLISRVLDKSKRDARDLLVSWADSLNEGTEFRVQDETQRIEESISQKVEAKLGHNALPFNFNATVERIKKSSSSEKEDVRDAAQEVIHNLPIKQISDAITLLEHDFERNEARKHYITIDRLDENWVEDEFRYALIRSMIETVAELNHRLVNVKIIIALRKDLIDRVFHYTYQPGYQSEKIDGLCLNLTWKRGDLKQLLNARIKEYFRQHHDANESPTIDGLFTRPKGIKSPADYLLDRTMLRPRDAILFFNECILAAVDKQKIGLNELRIAEREYSQKRIDSLRDEWLSTYPNLIILVSLLKKFPRTFHFEYLLGQRDVIETIFLQILDRPENDLIYQIASRNDNTDNGLKRQLYELFKILFEIGVIGIKPSNYEGIRWSYEGQSWVLAEADAKAKFHIHPMLWAALNNPEP